MDILCKIDVLRLLIKIKLFKTKFFYFNFQTISLFSNVDCIYICLLVYIDRYFKSPDELHVSNTRHEHLGQSF